MAAAAAAAAVYGDKPGNAEAAETAVFAVGNPAAAAAAAAAGNVAYVYGDTKLAAPAEKKNRKKKTPNQKPRV